MSTLQSDLDNHGYVYSNFLIRYSGQGAVDVSHIGMGRTIPFDPFDSEYYTLQLWMEAANDVPRSCICIWFPADMPPTHALELFDEYLKVLEDLDKNNPYNLRLN